MITPLLNHLLCNILHERGAIPNGQAHTLLTGANHAYSCTCDTCRDFWRLVGPDDDTGLYGPFGATIEPEGGSDHE